MQDIKRSADIADGQSVETMRTAINSLPVKQAVLCQPTTQNQSRPNHRIPNLAVRCGPAIQNREYVESKQFCSWLANHWQAAS